MEDEESPILQDIIFNSASMIFNDNDESLISLSLEDIDIDINDFLYPYDQHSSNNSKDYIEEVLANDNFNFSQTVPVQELNSKNDVEQKLNITSNSCLSTSSTHLSSIFLSFINPPEPIYHVRYVSEITDVPINGNLVTTKNMTKKNVSGRYVKGVRGRYITVSLPIILSDDSNLFIRVTRLTVPYQDTSFIHPYPLLYTCRKPNKHSDIIIQGSSIYYRINKEDICSRSKSFPNMILTRLKQCHLNRINNLHAFDNNETPCSFIGHTAKNKIAQYQLKKSQLDFRLVIRCEHTGTFMDTNIFCRSNSLLEEEGICLKKTLS